MAVTSGLISDMTRLIITLIVIGMSVVPISIIRMMKVSIDDDDEGCCEDETATSLEAALVEPDSPNLEDSVSAVSLTPFFVSVARVKDKALIATYSFITDQAMISDFESNAKKLCVALTKGKLKSESRMIQAKGYNICHLVDEKSAFIFCVMIPDKYDEKNALQALFDLSSACNNHMDEAKTCAKGGLTAVLQPTMESLGGNRKGTIKADAPKGSVLEKMHKVKNTIQNNVALAEKTQGGLTDLKEKTSRMTTIAKKFKDASGTMHWKQLLDRYKLWIIPTVVLFDIVVLFIVWKVL